MVSPVDELVREHALIRRMLAVLERIAGRVEAGAAFPFADAAVVLRFFREFVERVHHRKEHECCYPSAVLESHQEVVEAIGELEGDHEDSRGVLQGLLLFWEPGELLADERVGFAGLARTYARRLREHMAVEEESLYPAVRARIRGKDLDEVQERFARIGSGAESASSWEHVCATLEERWVAPQPIGPRRDLDADPD
jgi:hemerythrin-like domain-containing protein